ncbi:MAG: hypothetical protein K2X43_24505 [Hyphomonadaceae bacterium]|jgi:predicted lactoylglutathione lyase|nr:hypothetical protein [Hyphomonadaceae bacterium]
MQQQLSVITLGIADLARSRRFYGDGFGWTPVFQSDDILRAADAPPHGGLRGYIADPDDHAWEIAWNPAWPISPEGYVRFAPA